MFINFSRVSHNLYRLQTASFLILICFSFSSRAQKISADYEVKTDFTKYRTYAWLAPGDSVLNRYRSEKLYGGYITYAANQELKNRGMKLDTLRPDAIFIFD